MEGLRRTLSERFPRLAANASTFGFWFLAAVCAFFLSWCSLVGRQIAACERKTCPVPAVPQYVSDGVSGLCTCILTQKVDPRIGVPPVESDPIER